MKISEYVRVYVYSVMLYVVQCKCMGIYACTSERVVKSYSVSVFKDMERRCKLCCMSQA